MDETAMNIMVLHTLHEFVFSNEYINNLVHLWLYKVTHADNLIENACTDLYQV